MEAAVELAVELQKMCLKNPYFTRARDSTPDSIPVSQRSGAKSVPKRPKVAPQDVPKQPILASP